MSIPQNQPEDAEKREECVEAYSLARNPFELSAPYAVDPSYDIECIRPDPVGLSLFSNRRCGPQWLYSWGACEAYLFNRLRHESFFLCTNVDHPGRFRNFSPVLFARKKIKVEKPDANAAVRLCHCGHCDVRVNGVTVFHESAVDKPIERIVKYGTLLRTGENIIWVRVHAIGEPPTFVILDDPLTTGDDWEVSYDSVIWARPTCFAFEGIQAFPHRESLPAVELEPRHSDGGVYDFGVEVMGKPVFMAGVPGKVTVFAGESCEEALDSQIKHHEQVVKTIDVVPGVNVYPHELALRYLRLSTSSDLKIEGVKLRSTVYPAAYRGAFACSDDQLTRVWMHSAYTLRLCMRELFVDGIKRDRLPWVGDLYIGGLCNYFSFFEPFIVRNSLTALYGEEPERVDLSGIIDYSMYWLMALRDYLMHSGDTAFVERARPLVQRLLDALSAKEDGSGLIPTKSLNWLFIDWTEIVHEGYSSNLHMLYAMALDAAGEIMLNDGNSNGAKRCFRKARRLKEKCREIFWDENRRLFVDNAVGDRPGGHFTRHASALAILSGVAEERHVPHLLANVLLNASVPPVGTPYMAAFEARALARCGRKKEMLDFIRQTWGGMIQAGASTFWEAWDPAVSGTRHYAFYGRPFGKSLCHAWSSGPLFLLSSETFGAKPLEPGWKRFTVNPHAGELNWMSVAIPTPYGTVGICVEGETITVQVPGGAVFETRDQSERKRNFAGPCIVCRKEGLWQKL